MANATEYSMLFKLGAQLGKEFNSTFSSAQKTLSETQKQIVALNKQQGDITTYGKQQQAIEATNRKLTDLQKEHDNIQREIQETEGYSSALENKLIEKQRAIDKTSGSLQQQTEKLGKMKSALQEAGVDTDHLADESAKLAEQIDNLSEEQAEAAKSADEYGESGVSAFEAVGSALIAAGVLVGLKQLAEEYTECVTRAAAFADEIGTVSVQYGIAADDLQAYYYAAELVDVSSDTLTKSIAKQIKSMKAVQDGTKLSVEAYEKLGVSVQNADGTLRDSDDVYWEVIDALGAMSNETERDSIAQQILGRSAMELNTLIKAGSDVLKDYATEAKAAGYIMSEDMLAACMAMDDEMQRSKSGTLALKNAIGAAFAPEITSATKLWNQFLAGLTEFTQDNPVVVKSIIALAAEAGILLGVYTGYVTIKKVMNTVKALSTVLKAKETVATAAVTAATTAQAAATTAATAAQTSLNTAMVMYPIGLVLMGVAALTVGIIALSEAEKKNVNDVNNLTAASKEQYNQLQGLNAEYDEACASYGEASDEARALHGELILLQDDYESSKQTISEFNEAVKESTDEYYSFVDEHRKNISALNSEEDVLLALVTRLELLEHQTNKTEQEKEKMLVLVNQLNEKLPELGLSYDKVNDSLNSTAEAIRNVVEADIARKKYEENYNAYYEAVKNELDLEKQLATAKENTASAQKEYDELLNSSKRKQMLEEVKLVGDEAFGRKYATNWAGLMLQIEDAQKKLEERKKTQTSLIQIYDEALSTEEKLLDAMGQYKQGLSDTSDNTEDVEENTKKFRDALFAVQRGYLDVVKAASYYGVSSTVLQDSVDATIEYKQNLEEAVDAVNSKWYLAEEAAKIYGVTADSIVAAAGIQGTIDKIDKLGTAYHEVRNDAEQSIQGQYDLWDTASVVIAMSIGDINTALASQTDYWKDYNMDLANLSERKDDIQGLSEVISSFTDGSEDSVNTIAGMASASDDELKAMVSIWQERKKAISAIADNIGDIAIGGKKQIEELQSDLEDEVGSLNLDTEAASAAKATVDAYTQAIKDGTVEAVKAAETLASLVADALQDFGTNIDIYNSTSGEIARIKTRSKFATSDNTEKLNYNKYQAYANGTNSAVTGLALVGEEGPELVTFGGGEKVYTAKETQEFIRYMHDGTIIQAYANGTDEALQITTIVPLIQSYMEAMRSYRNEAQSESVSAKRIPEQHITITVSPNFTVEGNATDDLENRLRDFAEEIKQEVMDAIEDAGIDAKRGVYK